MTFGSVLSRILALSEFYITTHKAKSQDSPRRSYCFDMWPNSALLLCSENRNYSHRLSRQATSNPAFSIDNNYHYNLSQSRRQDQKRIEIRIITVQIVPCETKQMSHFDSGLIKLIKG